MRRRRGETETGDGDRDVLFDGICRRNRGGAGGILRNEDG